MTVICWIARVHLEYGKQNTSMHENWNLMILCQQITKMVEEGNDDLQQLSAKTLHVLQYQCKPVEKIFATTVQVTLHVLQYQCKPVEKICYNCAGSQHVGI